MNIENSIGFSHPEIRLATHHNYVVDNHRASQPGARAYALPQKSPSPNLKMTGRRGHRSTKR